MNWKNLKANCQLTRPNPKVEPQHGFSFFCPNLDIQVRSYKKDEVEVTVWRKNKKRAWQRCSKHSFFLSFIPHNCWKETEIASYIYMLSELEGRTLTSTSWCQCIDGIHCNLKRLCPEFALASFMLMWLIPRTDEWITWFKSHKIWHV